MVTQSTAGEGIDAFVRRYNRTAHRSLRPRLRARMLAWARADSLDRAVIEGVDPASSETLAARAALLTSPRTRRLTAAGLRRAASAARGPQRRWWAVSPHGPLAANAEAVRELAEIVGGQAPVYAAGLARINRLVTDGAGVAYRGQPRELARRLREARAALID